MFTPYYILAVGFGLFAVVVSVIGMKRPNDFPGKFTPLVVMLGIAFGIATFAFVWRGGEAEVDRRAKEDAEKAQKEAETGSTKSTLPEGAKLPS
ncbi:MAG: hypothetical protein HYX29_07225 [Solirubrobacterales bacterium]|nr:hypothetical protein [Solirubrobacterales bacterium]